MPELPEVETIRRDLRRVVLNKKITHVTVHRASTVQNDKRQFVKLLTSNHFTDIDRVGKLLIFNLSDHTHYLLAHLKMTGQMIYQWDDRMIVGGHSDSPLDLDVPNQYTRVTITFSDGAALHFNDLRAFGYMRIVGSGEMGEVLEKFGIEPLTEGFTFNAFAGRFKARKTSVKALLMNQAIFAGIGNIYADESCFAAGIRPTRRAASLTRGEIKRLYQAIQRVLKQAIKERGTTFNDYVDPYGRKGNFVKFLKVYGRGGEACKHCGKTLIKKKVAGRGTVFCARCQK